MARAMTRHISGMLQLANQGDILAGVEWYNRAHKLGVRLIHAYDGLTLGQAVGVIAALSPNNKWTRNCVDAEAMVKAWHYGADPMGVKVCTFNPNKAKAAAILALSDAETQGDADLIAEILNGRKVTAFYRSILGDPDAVCVDGHAYSVWIGERVPTTQTPSIGVKLYADIARAYQLVAKRSFNLCGVTLSPTQVQAVTWVTYRRLLGYN
jgi:hypothetical protein